MNAQYDPSFSHYFDLETTFNPASVGKTSHLNISAAYGMDFTGFDNNPRTALLSVDLPFLFLNQYHGAGVILLNDKIGLFTHQKLGVQYSYKHKMFGGSLGIGVQVAALSETFDGTKVDLSDSNDPAFSSSQISGNGIDLSVGLYYVHSTYYVGGSIQHVNSPQIELGLTNELQIHATYYLTGGYNIKLRNPFLTVKPSVLLRSDGMSYRGDISTRLVYSNDGKMMYGGLGYSPSNSLTFMIGGKIHGVTLGYSYEMYTSPQSLGNGSHELFIGYQTDMNMIKKGKNLHKSVRIL